MIIYMYHTRRIILKYYIIYFMRIRAPAIKKFNFMVSLPSLLSQSLPTYLYSRLS